MARKKKEPINGLGDAVKAVTNALGIETCDDCEVRRQKMNNMFSFLKNVQRDLTEEEIEKIELIASTKKVDDVVYIINLVNQIFGTKYQPCNCPGLVKEHIDKLIIQIEKQKIK